MHAFESEVQHIKYKVLKEVAKAAIEGTEEIERYKIPKKIAPGPEPITRCCVYKERAILEERVNLAVEPPSEDNNIIEVIDIACDQCPAKRFTVTEACRGCFAQRCVQVCPRNAISIIDGKSHINQDKCVECGKCKEVCPFNAIADVMRPCKKACGSKAIEIGEDKKVKINRDKCTTCGSCVYQCPFGAISERSEIVSVIKHLKRAKVGEGPAVYAVVAPAIASQFNANLGQIVNAIKMMGFKDVIEVALGADIVAYNEGLEYVEKVTKGEQDCLLSSCCPAFVLHIKKNYPELVEKISSMVSPMVAIARFVKKTDPDAKVVFMGPCSAKRTEALEDDIRDAADYVITFDELLAMLDAYAINATECEDRELDNASYFGRIFARSGGLGDAVAEVLKENNLPTENLKPVICDGIEECDKALKMLKVGKLDGNFIEGMTCKGGCIGGAASINHGPKDKKQVDKYAEKAMEKGVCDALSVINLDGIQLHRKHQ